MRGDIIDRALLDLLAFYQREAKEGRAALEKLHVHLPEVVEHFSLRQRLRLQPATTGLTPV